MAATQPRGNPRRARCYAQPLGDQETIPIECRKIRDHEITRLICAGNPFGGYAHAGEFKYVNQLALRYFTPEKIAETLHLCLQHGVNTTLTSVLPHVIEGIELSGELAGERIQWIAQIPPDRSTDGDYIKYAEHHIRLAAEHRAICAFVQGGQTQKLLEAGQEDLLRRFIGLIREMGMAPGVCAHVPWCIEKAEELQLGAEFYMLTLNKVGYVCDDPEAAKRTMRSIDKPFIAFKVLGAARDDPESGFKHALDAGADFLAVGMYDWQVKQNAELVGRLTGERAEAKG